MGGTTVYPNLLVRNMDSSRPRSGFNSHIYYLCTIRKKNWYRRWKRVSKHLLHINFKLKIVLEPEKWW